MSNRIVTVVDNWRDAEDHVNRGWRVIATHGGAAIHADEAAAAALFCGSHPDDLVCVFRIERDDADGLAWSRGTMPRDDLGWSRGMAPGTSWTADVVFDVGGEATGQDRAPVLDHHFLGVPAPKKARLALASLGGDPAAASGRDYQKVVDAAGSDEEKRALSPFSSCGLMLKYLQRLGEEFPPAVVSVIRSIDASDNGVSGVPHGNPDLPASVAMAVHKTAVVPLAGGSASKEEVASHFLKLVECFRELFEAGCDDWASAQFTLQLQELEEGADKGRQASRERMLPLVKAGGPVLVLDQYEASALDVLGGLAGESEVLYLVFPSEPQWMVQQAPTGPMPCFHGKKPLPEAWAGLRGSEFCAVTGVADGVFCHPGRFICGASSKAGAIALAELAVQA